MVLNHIANASVFITDLGEHYRDLLTGVFRKIGKAPPTRSEGIDFLARTELQRSFSEKLLTAAREFALFQTTIPQVESLVREAVSRAGMPSRDNEPLVDRNALREMNQKTFREFVTRFAVAFADCLSPDRQAANIISAIESERFLVSGYIAFVTLGEVVTINRFFDVGDAKAFNELEKAHAKIEASLSRVQGQFFWLNIRGGRLKQEDSAQLLGIQAADLAAAIASIEYEEFPNDRTAGIAAIKQKFHRVLVNGRWT